MITRLKVNGFKNLVDVDVEFGKFNVIAGINGVGKSNLFEVLRFVSDLTRMPLNEAARKVRGAHNNLKNIFSNHLSDDEKIIDIHICIPHRKQDDVLIEYFISMKWEKLASGISVLKEGMTVSGGGLDYNSYFSTDGYLISGDNVVWSLLVSPKILMDKYYNEKMSARDFAILAECVSSVQYYLSRMNYFYFDADSLRDIQATSARWMGESGRNLPGFLEWVFETDQASAASIQRNLFALNEDILDLEVEQIADSDIRRIKVTDVSGRPMYGESLSDGTLKMIAIISALEKAEESIIIIEEPENGIHASKIHTLMELFLEYEEKYKDKNFQLLISTHSPYVVSLAPSDSVIIAGRVSAMDANGSQYRKVKFYGLRGTWRAKDDKRKAASITALRAFLAPQLSEEDTHSVERVMERRDAQHFLELLRKR